MLITQIKRTLTVLLSAFFINANAATLTVNNVNDSGAGSLRQTIADAASGDTITFDTSLNGNPILFNSQIALTKSLTINGGQHIILDGSGLTRHFKIATAGISININNIVLQNGRATSRIDGSGGSIDMTNVVSTLTIDNSTIANNFAFDNGGAINTLGGTLTINNSTILSNTSQIGFGGGIHSTANFTLNSTTVTQNAAGNGGGLYLQGGTTLITNSTFSANTARIEGAAINAFRAPVTVLNSTFSDNGAGGGIINTDLPATQISDSVLASNNTNCATFNTGVLSFSGHNFSDDSSCGTTNVIESTGINLGPLADNGCAIKHATATGPECVKTHALEIGSVAIDAAISSTLSSDGRGSLRPQGVAVDSGAYEVNEPSSFTSTPITSVDDDQRYQYQITTSSDAGERAELSVVEKPDFLSLILTSASSITTVAGNSSAGFADSIDPILAQFNSPEGLAISNDGSLFVSDTENHRIRKIDGATGEVSTFAGSGVAGFADNINPLLAQFNGPLGLVIDADGALLVADGRNNRIRRINLSSGEVSTLAGSGGAGAQNNTNPMLAQFNSPFGLTLDQNHNLVVADLGNSLIRRVDMNTMEVTTVAGNGVAGFVDNVPSLQASFRSPTGVAVNNNGDIFVADNSNHRIRQIGAQTNLVTTVAGNGVLAGPVDNANPLLATTSFPNSIVIDALGNLFVATDGARIRRIDALTGNVTTFAGFRATVSTNNSDAPLSSAFFLPNGLVLSPQGAIFVADSANNRIRKVSASSAELIGDAQGQAGVHSIVLNLNDGNGLVTQQAFELTINDTTPPSFTSSTSVDFDENGIAAVYTPEAVDANPANTSIAYSLGTMNDESNFIFLSDNLFFDAIVADFENPSDADSNNEYIVEIIATDTAGNASSQLVSINVKDVNDRPRLLATVLPFTINDDQLYSQSLSIIDQDNDNLSFFNSQLPDFFSLVFEEAASVNPLAGDGDFGYLDNVDPLLAKFETPEGVVIDSNNNVFIADRDNNVIRRIDGLTNEVTTYAGDGSFNYSDNSEPLLAGISGPTHLALDVNDNLYVTADSRIRRIDALSGEVSTIAGSGDNDEPFDNVDPLLARFETLGPIVIDSANNIIVADEHVMRKVDGQTGAVTTIAGNRIRDYVDNVDPFQASFGFVEGLALDSEGNLFFSDAENNVIRRMDKETGAITTFAGSSNPNLLDSLDPLTAEFQSPSAIAIDAENNLFVSDGGIGAIRRIDGVTGEVTTLTANRHPGNPAPAGAVITDFFLYADIAINRFGRLVATDLVNSIVVQINPARVTLYGDTIGQAGDYFINIRLEDGRGGIAGFGMPFTVRDVTPPEFTSALIRNFIENQSGLVYTASATDSNKNNRFINFFLGTGNDEALFHLHNGELRFNSPPALNNPLDADRNNEYVVEIIVSDSANNTTPQLVTIKVIPNNLPIFTSVPPTSVLENENYNYLVTGSDPDGQGVAITVDQLPEFLSVVMVTPSINSVLAGTGQSDYIDNADPLMAAFREVGSMVLDSNNNIFVADSRSHVIRRIDAITGAVTTFAGSGMQAVTNNTNPLLAEFSFPNRLAIDANDNIYVGERTLIRRIDATTGAVTTFAGSLTAGTDNNTNPLQSKFNLINGLAIDSKSNIYVSDAGSSNRIRKIDGVSGAVSNYAGSGAVGSADNVNPLLAEFDYPQGLAIDKNDNLFVADAFNNLIRRVDAVTLAVTTFAGNGNYAFDDNSDPLQASFSYPSEIAFDAAGNILIADNDNGAIRRIDVITGAVTTISGTRNTRRLSRPVNYSNISSLNDTHGSINGLAVNTKGQVIFGSQTARVISFVNAAVIQVSGLASVAPRNYPVTVTISDSSGSQRQQVFSISVLSLDTDRDGILNENDNCPLISNPTQADLDRDNLGDPCDNDADGDGLPNRYELENGLNPLNSFDRDADPDGDGFTNRQEYEFGTNPQVADEDSNNDGIPDQFKTKTNIASIIQLLLLDDD